MQTKVLKDQDIFMKWSRNFSYTYELSATQVGLCEFRPKECLGGTGRIVDLPNISEYNASEYFQGVLVPSK